MLQTRLDLGARHVVDLDAAGFTIAHTDAERASDAPLHRCMLHRWLMKHGPEQETGLFVVERLLEGPDDAPYVFTALSQHI